MWKWLLAAAVAVDVLLWAQLAGISLAPLAWAVAVFAALLCWILLDSADAAAPGRTRACGMVIGAHLGMLVGTSFDFGPLGLVVLASWCGDNTGLDAAWRMLLVAPWAHAGMAIGGTAGAALTGALQPTNAARSLVAMAFAMLVGDAVACALAARGAAAGPFAMPFAHVGAMLLVTMFVRVHSGVGRRRAWQ
jgi:hypothetical protein